MRQTQGIIGMGAINSFGESQMIEPKLIQHHEKYRETHGEDKIKLMTRCEHIALHRRLRKDGKCKVPVTMLARVSQSARKRLLSYKQYNLNYHKQFDRAIEFSVFVEAHVRLIERITINLTNGHIRYFARFRSDRFKLSVVDI